MYQWASGLAMNVTLGCALGFAILGASAVGMGFAFGFALALVSPVCGRSCLFFRFEGLGGVFVAALSCLTLGSMVIVGSCLEAGVGFGRGVDWFSRVGLVVGRFLVWPDSRFSCWRYLDTSFDSAG